MTGENVISPSAVLNVEGLVKIYGKRRVVDGVSFHVNKGEIVGLLGPNGAGKTTSFRMACGLINTNGGIVHLGGQDVTNWAMYRRSREGGMGYLPQEKSVFQKLSVQNNLLAVMEMLGMKRSERKKRCDELLEKFHLTHLRRNYGGGLSGGERRRLEIARALVSNPKIILLDEPFAAVDPITVTGIQDIIRQLSQDGIAILITDHSVQDTLQITQRSYVIQAGQVLCHGTPEEVLGNPEARKVYFGENVSVEQIRPGFTAAGKTDWAVVGQNEVAKHTTFLGHRHRPPSAAPAAVQDNPYSDPEWDTIVLKPENRKLPEDKKLAANFNSQSEEQSTPSADKRSRLLGKRLTQSAITMPERPVVQNEAGFSESGSLPEDKPEAGMSGIIRSLGARIWAKTR
ncbi:MAG: LPS export ABC transporter ATP-binding protein [Planctomycetaceae bacterium]|jgi:lipopolysaccharide export system ATP-binding protein|nr:LPS export ABC transporter ATP-binding protein [Planctomycetaceae bacterium]